MEEDHFPSLSPSNVRKTNENTSQLEFTTMVTLNNDDEESGPTEKQPLSTKSALKFLIEGNLKSKVCRYCLNVDCMLSELDQILNIAGSGTIYKVTIRDIVASFHPVKVADDPNFPNKICDKCLKLAISSFLFTQQCERAERALRNCLTDIYDKVDKLDRMDNTKKRGRQKLHPNYNVIHAEFNYVIEYAKPTINIINRGTETMYSEPIMTELECARCWQVLPNIESLLIHERTHPKNMWYNCRLCGKSFPKHAQMKKHYHRVHVLGLEPIKHINNDFNCAECGHITDNYKQHLLHVEKHKFKNVMEHLVENKMDKLCMVCFDKSNDLVELENMVSFHGGCPELMGDKPLYSILASTLPDMIDLHNFIGTKVCSNCLNNAITSYVFINQFSFARERLDLCISHMLKNLNQVQPNGNLVVQINENTITPYINDFDEMLLLNENDFIDETKIKSDVLEDEFRESESDTDTEVHSKTNGDVSKPVVIKTENDEDFKVNFGNPAKNATQNIANGFNTEQYTDVCSEFLTFNKRLGEKSKVKFTCTLCYKRFISKYFLKRHILKHVNRKVECNLCDKIFKTKFNLLEHKKMSHALKLNNCPTCKVCGRTFIKEKKLKAHEKKHTSIECELCYKIFVNQSYFYSHIQKHSKELKNFNKINVKVCSFCEKECSNDKILSLHVNKVHLEIKPYSCDMCDRQFYVESNLKHHKKVHSMKTYETCIFCYKTFKCRKQLVIHVRKHIGVKPFKCQVCAESFYSQFKVKKHMEDCHGGKYNCSMCKLVFMTKIGLRNHLKNEHSCI